MESNKNVLEILDYWFAIEFLAQESYEVCTSESEIIRKFKKFKNASKSIKDKRKQITVFEKINEQLDIHDLIDKQAEECNMETWGNLTFYIGKIRRQICIEKLAGMLGIKQFEQAEKSFDYIPVLSFQCRSDGTYIENSLSLSTVVWALSQLAEQNKISISEALSVKTYSNNLKELEKNFFKLIKQENKEIVSDPKDLKYNDFITSEMIDKIHNNLVNLYGKYVGEKSIEKNNVFKYQLFSDSEAKQRYCDDNYMGLSHDFYSNDLKLVKKAIEERKYDLNSGIMPELIKYICGPKDITQKRERYDFINIEDKDEFMNNLLEILNIGNAPLGKWPSRYMPALMQQVAINLSISNNDHGIFEKKGKIFSVNGPPGTGKTTLLKEIIANNIVEKACILSQYDIPDEAFEKVNFVHGKYANGAYSQYYPSWYRFKDNRIADYGILVASCNNNAVENITKELPLKKGILDNLNIIDGGDNADSTIMQKKIMEIRELFSINDKNNADVYFTSYARKFLGNDKQEADAWGLIAASLGKKSNISKFYYDVIAPLLDFLKSNNDIKKRISQYKNTKEKFCNQLEKVKALQKKIKECCDLAILAHQRQISFKKVKEKNENLIKELQLQTETVKHDF